MLKELLDSIMERTKASNDVQIVDVPGARKDRPFVRVGSELKELKPTPPAKRIVVNSIESLIQMAVTAGDRAAVYVSTDSVELIYDVEDGTDRATFPLGPSAEFAFLQALTAAGGKISQEDLIDALNFCLRDCLPDADRKRFVAQVESLKWSANADVDSKVARGVNSMGTSISTAVAVPTVLPDEIQVFPTVRRWATGNFTSVSRLKLHFDVDTDMRVFCMRVFPNSLAEHTEESLSYLHERLADAISPKIETSEVPAVTRPPRFTPVIRGTYRRPRKGDVGDQS